MESRVSIMQLIFFSNDRDISGAWEPHLIPVPEEHKMFSLYMYES